MFKGRISENFDLKEDFKKIGVINQTTMLAEETQEISYFFEKIMEKNMEKKMLKITLLTLEIHYVTQQMKTKLVSSNLLILTLT